MILKVFTKPNCPNCPAAKKLVKKLRVTARLPAGQGYELQIEEYDVSMVDGLAEASFYSVMSTPSLILCDERGKEVWGWRGETPTLKKLTEKLCL